MYPLHPGHAGSGALVIVLLSTLALAAAFALARTGRSRAGALLGTAVLAGVSRAALGFVGHDVAATVHLAAHGLELGAVVAFGLACGCALADAITSTPSEG